MADGKVSLPYKQFLGYEKGEDGLPKIVESEAKIIRIIFHLYLEGKTPSAIAKQLVEQGIPSPAGKKNWQVATVRSILSNEKYKGDALLQKGFTVDFLTKKRKVNKGEVPQYYVQNSHPAIIIPDEFDAVQAEMERRRQLGRPCSCNSPFSAKIVCGECGGYYGSKVWGSNTKYHRVIWRCNDKYKGGKKCDSPHVTEDEIKRRFLTAFNTLMGGRDELLENCRLAREVLCDCTAIDKEIEELRRESEIVAELARSAIYENARTATNEKNEEYLQRYSRITERISSLEAQRLKRRDKAKLLENFIRDIQIRPLVLDEFDEKLWIAMVDKTKLLSDGRMQFYFKDGSCVEA
jgi:site-specific DNA recombinase